MKRGKPLPYPICNSTSYGDFIRYFWCSEFAILVCSMLNGTLPCVAVGFCPNGVWECCWLRHASSSVQKWLRICSRMRLRNAKPKLVWHLLLGKSKSLWFCQHHALRYWIVMVSCFHFFLTSWLSSLMSHNLISNHCYAQATVPEHSRSFLILTRADGLVQVLALVDTWHLPYRSIITGLPITTGAIKVECVKQNRCPLVNSF